MGRLISFTHLLEVQPNKTGMLALHSFACVFSKKKMRLQASTFMAGNHEQVQELRQMGIRIVTMADGRVQLLHTASEVSEHPQLTPCWVRC